MGSLAYCSPEIVSGAPHSHSTDVWSLGIVLYTMLTRRMPFVEPTWERTQKNITTRPINFEQSCWAHVGADAKDLVSKMLAKSPLERITCE